jgi:hypothetical protein
MELAADLQEDPPTLASWARKRTDKETAFLVMLKRHWVVVRGDWFVDTYTRGVPVRLKNAPHPTKAGATGLPDYGQSELSPIRRASQFTPSVARCWL